MVSTKLQQEHTWKGDSVKNIWCWSCTWSTGTAQVIGIFILKKICGKVSVRIQTAILLFYY